MRVLCALLAIFVLWTTAASAQSLSPGSRPKTGQLTGQSAVVNRITGKWYREVPGEDLALTGQINLDQILKGNATAGLGIGNQISTSQDELNVGTGAANYLFFFFLSDTLTTPAIGGRVGFQSYLHFKQGVSASNGTPFFIANSGVLDIEGSDLASIGSDFFGANFQVHLMSGASASELTGLEINVDAETGSTAPAYKTYLQLIQESFDKFQGTLLDLALTIVIAPSGTAPGWHNLITFGDPRGWWPCGTDTGCTLINAGLTPFAGGPAKAADTGINFAGIAFGSYILRSDYVTLGPQAGGTIVNGKLTGGAGTSTPVLEFHSGQAAYDARIWNYTANGLALTLNNGGTNAALWLTTGTIFDSAAGGAHAFKINGTQTVGIDATGINSGSILTDTINKEFQVASATLTATSNTTLATVTGLSQALTAGKTYACSGHLTGTANASGGLKVALVASGGLTATSASFTGNLWNGTTAVANTTVTALGSNIAANTAAYTDLWIDGAIVVNAGGTINVQAAQNASFGTSTTVLLNSTFNCVRTI